MTILILQEAPLRQDENSFQISSRELVEAMRASNISLNHNKKNQQVNFLKGYILQKTGCTQIPLDVDKNLLVSLFHFLKN